MTDTTASPGRMPAETTAFAVILAVSVCHLINDMMQSLLSAIYPMLKADYGLDFWQIGLLTLTFQVTASLLQPAVGIYTDKRPMPYSLPVGMGFVAGRADLARLCRASMRCCSSARRFIGIGSAIFHPESSRVARLASGGRYGLAQSLLPGRRQFRHGARAAAGRLHRRAARPGERRLVLAGGASSA